MSDQIMWSLKTEWHKTNLKEAQCGQPLPLCQFLFGVNKWIKLEIWWYKVYYRQNKIFKKGHKSRGLQRVEGWCDSTVWCPQKEVAKAWKINPSEPIVIRLHFSLSQYLDGPGEHQQRCCKLSFTQSVCNLISWRFSPQHLQLRSFNRPTKTVSASENNCKSQCL